MLSLQKKKQKKNSDITDFQKHWQPSIPHWKLSFTPLPSQPVGWRIRTRICVKQKSNIWSHICSQWVRIRLVAIYFSLSPALLNIAYCFPRQQKRRGKISRESRVFKLKIFISFFILIICACVKEEEKDSDTWCFRNILFIILINTNPM